MIQGIEKQMEKDLNANPTLPLSIIMDKCLEQIFILVQASTTHEDLRCKISKEASYYMKLEHEPKVELGMVKCIFTYTHANKPQEI